MLGQGLGTAGELMRRQSFEVQIDTFDSILFCKTVTIPRTELDSIEVNHFNETIKIPGKPKASDIRLELYDPINPDLVTELWNWYKQIYNPLTAQMGYASNYKKHGQIFLYDVTGVLIRTWTMQGLWLKSPPTPEETLDYSSHDPVTLSLTLSCDRVSLDGGVSPFGGQIA
jgi:hypothetical protein